MTLPTNPTFDFRQSGVSGDLSFGKGGPRLVNSGGDLQLLTASGLPGNIIINQGNFTAIGIGTSQIVYPLDVWGNVHISNTATSSGIIFPDGTFQSTATKNTPSFGIRGTIQFAGVGNAFAGDSSHLFWDYTSNNLVLDNGANLIVNGYATALNIIGNNLTVSNTATVNNFVSNTAIYSAEFNTAGVATVNSLASNTEVSGLTGIFASDAYAGQLNVSGIATVNALVSNGAINGTSINGTDGTFNSLQSSGTATVNALVSNTTISGNVINFNTGTFTNLQVSGNAVVNAFTSNTYVDAVNGTFTNTLYSGDFNTAGVATVNSLNSNGAIVGTTINGTAGTFTSLQNSGITLVDSLNSNTNVVATNLQSTGLTSVDSLNSNNTVTSNNLQVLSDTTLNILEVTGSTTTQRITVHLHANVDSLSSNTVIYAAGRILGGSVDSLSTMTAAGLIIGNDIRSNGFVEASTIKSSGLAQLNSVITNTEITANTVNVITGIVSQQIVSNTSIQSADVIADQIYANLNVTSENINALNQLSANILTANTTSITADLSVSGIVNVTNTAQSYGSASGALVVTGGAGIGGNLNVGGATFIAGNLRVAGNLIVTGNSSIINSNVVSILGPTIEVGNESINNDPLTVNDGYDRGIVMNYYITDDNHAFLGWQNSTGDLVYITNVQPNVSNVYNPFEAVPGYVYGRAHFGSQYLSNTTVSTNTTTGALIVAGGVGIGDSLNTGGQISSLDGIRAVNDIQSNGVRSNSFVSAAGTITGNNIESNTAISATNMSATNTITGLLLAANDSVTSNNITALNYITGNVLVGNVSVFSPILNITDKLFANTIISNSSVTATTVNATQGDFLQVNAFYVNTSLVTRTGYLEANGYISSNTVNVRNDLVANRIHSNTSVSGQDIYSNTMGTGSFVSAGPTVVGSLVSNSTIAAASFIYAQGYYSNNFVQADSFILGDRLISNSTIRSNSTLWAGEIYSNSFIQATGQVVAQYLYSNIAIQANDKIVGDSLRSNTFIQANGTITGQRLVSNGDIQSSGTLQANYVVANIGFTANNITVGGSSQFNVLVSNTSITAGTYIIANVAIGIGTATYNYPLDVYGNIHIGNSNTASGIIFPDGSFQTTSATSTLSYGIPGTVQFAGAANSFSGNGDNLFWDNNATRLTVNELKVIGYTSVDSLSSNTNVVATNIQSVGRASVSSLASNGTVTGTHAGFTSIQSSTTTLTDVLISNVYGLFGQNVTVNSTNPSISTTTGALVVGGGIGIGGNIVTGGSVNYFAGRVGIGTNNPATQLEVMGGAILADGPGTGLYVSNVASFRGSVNNDAGAYLDITGGLSGYTAFTGSIGINTTTPNSNLDVRGGVGVTGASNFNSSLSVGSLISNGAISGTAFTVTSLQSSGTATVNALVSNVYGQFGQNVTVNSTNASTNTATGALVVGGGIGLGGDVNAGGNIAVAGHANVSALTSRGTVTVEKLSSNSTVSGNTWVLDGNSYTSSSTFQQVVDSWPATEYRTAHYFIQITDQTNSTYQSGQVMLIHDGTDVYITEYNYIYTSGSLGEFDADIVGGVVELIFTPANSGTMVIKTVRTTIDL